MSTVTESTAPHGTNARYQTPCRCQLCRDAAAAYQRQRMARMPLKRRREIERRDNYRAGFLCVFCYRPVSNAGGWKALSVGQVVKCPACAGKLRRLDPADWKHGKESTYKKLGCRCGECRKASNLARRDRRLRAA